MTTRTWSFGGVALVLGIAAGFLWGRGLATKSAAPGQGPSTQAEKSRRASTKSSATGETSLDPADFAADHEPQLAWTYALSLSDPQKQQDAMEKAAKQWLRVDDKSARAGIESSGLSPIAIGKLLKRTD